MTLCRSPRLVLLIGVTGVMLSLGAGSARADQAQAAARTHARAGNPTYTTAGTVRRVGPNQSFVTIAHEDIPGFMKAMTMAFEPKEKAMLDGLAAGDKVSFAFEATGDGKYVLLSIKKS